jgi:hypothetical protein
MSKTTEPQGVPLPTADHRPRHWQCVLTSNMPGSTRPVNQQTSATFVNSFTAVDNYRL